MSLKEILPLAFVAFVLLGAMALGELQEGAALTREVQVAMPQPRSFTVGDSLLAEETLVPSAGETLAPAPPILPATATTHPATPRAAAQRKPLVVASTARARIHVEARRLRGDPRIEARVIDAIARTPNLSGRIGVEAKDAVVELTGWTMTAGQSLRAEKAARRVRGVRHVVNEIRPRIGGVTS